MFIYSPFFNVLFFSIFFLFSFWKKRIINYFSLILSLLMLIYNSSYYKEKEIYAFIGFLLFSIYLILLYYEYKKSIFFILLISLFFINYSMIDRITDDYSLLLLILSFILVSLSLKEENYYFYVFIIVYSVFIFF